MREAGALTCTSPYPFDTLVTGMGGGGGGVMGATGRLFVKEPQSERLLLRASTIATDCTHCLHGALNIPEKSKAK